MSNIVSVACDRSTTVRKTGSTYYGWGQSEHGYVGKGGSSQYWTYLHFPIDWSLVGNVVSATLVCYTDDYGGDFAYDKNAKPVVWGQRVTHDWAQGSHSSWSTSDDVEPTVNSTNDIPGMSAQLAANGLNRFDITKMVRAWAPVSVSGGGKQPNYGVRLSGNTDTSKNWSLWTRMASGGNAAYRPTLEIVFEYGATAPNVPANLTPIGSVVALDAFQGDFSDIKTTDRLAKSEVEVYTAGATASASASTDSVNYKPDMSWPGNPIMFTSLTGGAGLSTGTTYYVLSTGLTTGSFKVGTTPGGTPVNITSDYSSVTFINRMYGVALPCTNTESVNGRFNHVPDSLTIAKNRTYQWRARVTDQEAMTSPWTSLVSFSVSDSSPNPPTVKAPGNAFNTASLDGVQFQGLFGDPDAGDQLFAFQIQMSSYGSGDSHWLDADNILWDTGKRYVPEAATSWSTPYGGQSLPAGTYYWRVRVWDKGDAVSAWTYTMLSTSSDFVAQPGGTTSAQIRPRAPWRIVVKEMAYDNVGGALTGTASTGLFSTASDHGLTIGEPIRFSALSGASAGLFAATTYYVLTKPTARTFTIASVSGGSTLMWTGNVTSGQTTAVVKRGPGKTVAILEHAKSVGASIVYNSPGEAHWTLTVDDPQLSAIQPKLTHYAIQFYWGDGWREVFAGLVWDVDATEKDIVFYGIDYLALLDYAYDERYDPARPDLPAESGGSKYITATKNTIGYIVNDQLVRACSPATNPHGPTGFISVSQSAAALVSAGLSETLVVYSTYQPVLQFVTGLLDSHRNGTGKRTRIMVQQKTGGGYEVVVIDDPAVTRNNLRLKYGELVQGYRVVYFGKNWATRLDAVGQTKEGIKVLYQQAVSPAINEAVWGRYAQTAMFQDLSDANDLHRRATQQALKSSKLGSQVGLGIRSGVLGPLDGYDLTDNFPITIQHGAIDTTRMGSGYWAAVAVTWESSDLGQQVTTLTFQPKEDTVAPDPTLLGLNPISTQQEWQVGWQVPVDSYSMSLRAAMDTGLVMDSGHVMDEDSAVHAKNFFDSTTGKLYYLADDGATWLLQGAPAAPTRPETVMVATRNRLNPDGTSVVNLTVSLQ